jgi:hypothetical protein
LATDGAQGTFWKTNPDIDSITVDISYQASPLVNKVILVKINTISKSKAEV